MNRGFTLWAVAWVVLLKVAHAADELTPKEMAAAHKVYVAKCAKCHPFYDPLKYSAKDWQTWMDKMSRKSKLKPEQELLLNKYLDAYRTHKISKP